MDQAMLHVSSRKARIPKDDDCNTITESIQERTKAMVERNKSSTTTATSFETVLERIRSSAMEKLQEIHKMHEIDIKGSYARCEIEAKNATYKDEK